MGLYEAEWNQKWDTKESERHESTTTKDDWRHLVQTPPPVG